MADQDSTRSDADLAPPDPSWHLQYARWLRDTQDQLRTLQKHPSFDKAEDLGDYVDTILTLFSFAPHTRPDIMEQARKEVR